MPFAHIVYLLPHMFYTTQTLLERLASETDADTDELEPDVHVDEMEKQQAMHRYAPPSLGIDAMCSFSNLNLLPCLDSKWRAGACAYDPARSHVS